MSILQRACQWVVEKASGNTPPEAVISQFQDGQPYRPKHNTAALIARNVSWAYSAVNLNSNSVSMAPWKLYSVKPNAGSKARFLTRPVTKEQLSNIRSKASLDRRCAGKEVEEVLCHPAIDLLLNVNPTMNQYGLRYLTEQSIEVTGNAFWWKCRNSMGIVEELWFMYPQFMQVVADKTNYIAGFKYGTGQKAQFVPIEDIVYFRQVDISSPVLGVGQMSKGIVAVDLSNLMNDHSINLIGRGGTPETVMSFPQEQVVSNDEIKRMKRDYKQKYRGTRNAGGLMITTGGAKIDKLSFSQKEMEYLGGRKWTRDEIFTVFGVPTTFSDVSAVSRANADSANTEYQRRTIKPKLIMTEDTINDQLVSDFDESLFVAFDENVPVDEEFRLKERASNIQVGYTSVNEERIRDGLDPIEDGDEHRNPNVSANVSIDGPAKRVKRFPSLGMPAANFIPENFVEAVQKYLKRFGDSILDQAKESEFKNVKIGNPDDIVSSWFDFTIWDKEAENTILPFIRASILLNAPKALASVNPDRPFDESSPGVASLLEERRVVIRGFNRTIMKDTRSTIAAGIQGGENVSQIKNRIEGVFGFKDRNRALRIARTETIWALNAGAVEGYKQSGVVSGLEWSTAEDERVCQWCGPMDGKIVSIDQDFWKMGDTMTGREGGKLGFETSNIGHPPLHPQCRCALIPVAKEV